MIRIIQADAGLGAGGAGGLPCDASMETLTDDESDGPSRRAAARAVVGQFEILAVTASECTTGPKPSQIGALSTNRAIRNIRM